MQKLSLVLSAALLSHASAFATDLNLEVRSGGQTVITVAPGEVVSYEVVAELGDALNEGLAAFITDVAFDGGTLSAASAPSAGAMLNFDRPAGLSNPQGFGGVASGGGLLQVGGAQNTINNTFAAAPVGSVMTGLAKPGAPLSVVTGNVTAPLQVGTYTLSLVNVEANVIVQGETGFPFWATEKAPTGTVTNLTIEVSGITTDTDALSLSGPSPQNQVMSLHAGASRAGQTYFLLGSLAGTSPGIPVGGGVVLPLNPDFYLTFLVNNPNPGILPGSMGVLNGQGEASATFKLPANVSPALAGTVINHAYILVSLGFASEAAPLTLTP